MTEFALEAHDISKNYGATRALDRVSLGARTGRFTG